MLFEDVGIICGTNTTGTSDSQKFELLLLSKFRKKERYLKHNVVTEIICPKKNVFCLALDPAGKLYIVDAGEDLVYKYDPETDTCKVLAGKQSTSFPRDKVSIDKECHALETEFDSPYCVAIDKEFNCYIADWGHKCIRKYNPKTQMVSLYVKCIECVHWLLVNQTATENALYYADGAYLHNSAKRVVKLDLDTKQEISRSESYNWETGAEENVMTVPGLAGFFWFDESLYFFARGTVAKYDLLTRRTQIIATLPDRVSSLVGDPDHAHCIYASTQTTIYKIH